MRKAKNVFAILAIVFGVIATALLMLHPVIDGVAVGMTEGAAPAMAYGDYFNTVIERIKSMFDFGWITSFSLDGLKSHAGLVAGVVGLIVLIVLFILMLCKKHAKGLGWWFPLLVILLLSTVVTSVYMVPDYLMNVPGVTAVEQTKYFGLGGLIVAFIAIALVVVASILYMVYVCKARKTAKKVDDARAAAIAKIDALLGGNK